MSLKQKVVKGFAWTLLERFSMQGVSLLVTMMLARLVAPEAYGTIALSVIFINISNVLVDGGLGGALVQKKDATEGDFNTVFYLSLFLSVILYVGIFFTAPWIADFYQTLELKNLLRFLALSLIFNALNSVQGAELVRKMLFHLSFRISLCCSVTSAIVGITLAFLGYGPWALAWSTIAGGIVGVITRWYFIAWRPRLTFSWHSYKGLFRYGWKLAVASLLANAYGDLHGLLIGKFYNRASLAFVTKGSSVPRLVMDAINGSLGRVAFPALAQVQDQREKVRDTMRRMITSSTFLVFPMMTGCAICADNLVLLLLGPNWCEAISFARIACFTFALWPFHTINLQAINALGRSDIFLILEIIKKSIGLIVLIVAIPLGVWWMMALGAFIAGPLSVIVNSWPNRKLLNYTIGMQLHDVLPALSLCGIMAVVILPIAWLPLPGWVKLLLQVPSGTLTYFFCAWLFRLAPLCEIARMVGTVLRSRTPILLQPFVNGILSRLT